MKLNENTVICGDKVILVPYRPEHVARYHEWMQSEELLELTASEPLSYEEEQAMQQKWHLDDDKLTFILLERPSDLTPDTKPSLSHTDLKRCRMIGDVNMFLPNGKEDDGECEIMIAEQSDRKRGFGLEALILFLSYAIRTLPIPPSNLIARIGQSNKPSIRLFQRLGFALVKVVTVFEEVEMRWGWEQGGEEGGSLKTRNWEYEMPAGRISAFDEPVQDR